MLVPDGNYSARNSIGNGSFNSFRSVNIAYSCRSSVSGLSRSRRSSSISMRLPTTEQCESYMLTPRHRNSVTSAWNVLRGSMVSISKVFLFAPFSRHKCCLGCVSLRDAVPLICVAELVAIALLLVATVDLFVSDGRLFYTTELEGRGRQIATIVGIMLGFSVLAIATTLCGWHYRKRQLYLVHIIWQWTALEATSYITYLILQRVFQNEYRSTFLLPSAIVLSCVVGLALIVQLWWLFVFIDALFFENDSSERGPSSCSYNSKRNGKVNNDATFRYYQGELDSISTNDSRRQSFTIPIVKLRKASEDIDRIRTADTDSLPGLRLCSVMEDIQENHDNETAEL